MLAAARAHIHVDRAAAVLVGDAAVVASSLEVVGFGPVEVIRDDDETAEAVVAGSRRAERRRTSGPPHVG